MDLSPTGNSLEAINNLYQYLRDSEQSQSAEMVLIADVRITGPDEHIDALFDRLFRAVSGQGISLNIPDLKYTISNL